MADARQYIADQLAKADPAIAREVWDVATDAPMSGMAGGSDVLKGAIDTLATFAEYRGHCESLAPGALAEAIGAEIMRRALEIRRYRYLGEGGGNA